MKCSTTVLVLAAALAGCSSSTSPSPIAGTWNLTASNLTGEGGTCSLTGTVQFTQNGGNLGGNLPNPGVVVNCTNTTGTSTGVSTGNDLIMGYVSGVGVSFNLDTGSVIASGNVTGNGMMSGTTIVVWYPHSSINVTGSSWSATLTSP